MTKRKTKGPAQAKSKKKVWGSKQVLSSPFAPVMPAASACSREAILCAILSAIPSPFAARSARPSRQSQQDSEPCAAAPSCKKPPRLLVGVNEVTRALERGHVALALVARDVTPALLVAHLPPLCFVAGARLVVVPGDGTDVGQVLGTRRVLAMAVAKRETRAGGVQDEDKDENADETAEKLLKELAPLAVKLDYPWLAAAKRGKGKPPKMPDSCMRPHRSKMDMG